jgi:hypothetical protein
MTPPRLPTHEAVCAAYQKDAVLALLDGMQAVIHALEARSEVRIQVRQNTMRGGNIQFSSSHRFDPVLIVLLLRPLDDVISLFGCFCHRFASLLAVVPHSLQ